jgi:hypothetical protein
MKGYKVFGPDWKCREFQYEVGVIYEIPESPIICERGFHFCERVADCFNYYPFDSANGTAATGTAATGTAATGIAATGIAATRTAATHRLLLVVLIRNSMICCSLISPQK